MNSSTIKQITRKKEICFFASIILLVSFSYAHATNYSTSIFVNSEKIANSNSYQSSIDHFSFQPPPNWTLSSVPSNISNNAIAIFTNNNKNQISTIVIFHKFISKQIEDAVNSNSDSNILNEVAREMTYNTNDTQTSVQSYGIERFVDAVRISVITSTLNISDNSTSFSAHVIYFLNSGEQYTLVYTSNESTFQRNLSLFENSIDSFYVNPHDLPAQVTNSNIEHPISIPSWIKNNAKWWADGTINDEEFIKSIQYMMDSGIIIVPHDQTGPPESKNIPAWVKNNAKLWADGTINDEEFAKGIEYLITNGMLKI